MTVYLLSGSAPGSLLRTIPDITQAVSRVCVYACLSAKVFLAAILS
jgi:hypothetical protein